jgi:hypothetical protein
MEGRTYGEKDLSILSNPSSIFPENKIKKIITAEPKQQLFKKQDAEAILKRQFNAKFQGDNFWQIPLSDGTGYILVYRIVILRTGSWGINGLYKDRKRVATPAKSLTFIETLEELEELEGYGKSKNFTDFINVLKEAVKGSFDWKFK